MKAVPTLISSNNTGLDQAVKALLDGEVVAFPTETVYGLGALVTLPQAIQSIFKAKGRPENHPLIVHVADHTDLQPWADIESPMAQALINAFWPGPLTIIVPKGPKLSTQVTGGQNSVGVRCPQNHVAQALLKRLPAPLAAPSANRFGKLSPTCVNHVMDELTGHINYVLEGEASQVGIESTIVSLLSDQPVLLRPGSITKNQLEAVLKCPVIQHSTDQENSSVRYSGGLSQHYSPNKKLYVCSPCELDATLQNNASNKPYIIGWAAPFVEKALGYQLIQLPDNPVSVAENLYAALRKADQSDSEIIIIEKPLENQQWAGVADRLKRASAKA